jgi:hypothetical protein
MNSNRKYKTGKIKTEKGKEKKNSPGPYLARSPAAACREASSSLAVAAQEQPKAQPEAQPKSAQYPFASDKNEGDVVIFVPFAGSTGARHRATRATSRVAADVVDRQHIPGDV